MFRNTAIMFYVLIAMLNGSAVAETRYDVLDLGAGVYPSALNNSGQTVGHRFVGGGAYHAFRTQPNQPFAPSDDLGTLGGTNSRATAINELGQVVGVSEIAGTIYSHAFRTAPNQPINPSTDDLNPGWAFSSRAYAINSRGEVAGYSGFPNMIYQRAFRTAPNSAINPATDILDTQPGVGSEALAMNENGQVAGFTSFGGSGGAFRTGPGASINYATDYLGTLGGGHSVAYAINDRDQVAGCSFIAGDGEYHPTLTAPGGRFDAASDLDPAGGRSSYALGLNNRGEAVGVADLAHPSSSFAFFAAGKGLVDLNSKIDPMSGWRLRDAADINELGQIVGSGYFKGQLHGFLLTPVPEPATLILLAFSALGLLNKRPTNRSRNSSMM